MDRRQTAAAEARPGAPGAREAPGGGAEGILGASRNLPGPRLGRVILVVVLLCYVTITILNILSARLDPTDTPIAVTCLVAIFALQLLHSRPGAAQATTRSKCLTLTAQALLTYLPFVALEAQWGAMAGFLAGSLLLLLPARSAWTLYGAVGATMLVPPLLNGDRVVDIFYFVQTTLLTGLVVYGLTRLADLIRVLHDTRGELTRAAVTKERLRFARDLHDLLGYSLSAITLKGELILRLIPSHPERAGAEVEDVLEISRQSLADVRRVASGYRDMSLQQEIGSARSVLSAAEVQVTTTVRIGTVSSPVDTVLATVLREAVTNVLRHSRPTVCEILAVREGTQMVLSVTNDGVRGDYRDSSPHSGSGLGNLQLRLSEVAGTLTPERRPGGVYRLTARAPAEGARLSRDGAPVEGGGRRSAA